MLERQVKPNTGRGTASPRLSKKGKKVKITSDIHIHTNLSSCAQPDALLERYVENAPKDGINVLGFANHLWDSDRIDGVSKWYSPQNLEHVLKLKEELPASREINGIKLLFGCETEFTWEGKLCLAEESFENFDYVLVPHSHTHMEVVVPRSQIADSKMHAKFLMDSFMRLVEHPLAHRITAVAHPFVPGTRYAIYNEVQSLIPDTYLFEAFQAANESGIAIEMNGSCLVYQNEWDIPYCEYVRIYSIAHACNCRFTYGSDSHSSMNDRQLKTVEKFLDQCGIRDNEFLTVDEIIARNR